MKKEINTTMIYDNTFDYLFDQAVEEKEKENNKYFIVEYGCYGNYTKAIIQKIYPTEYDHIVEVDYTIPDYTGEEIHHRRLLTREIKEIQGG